MRTQETQRTVPCVYAGDSDHMYSYLCVIGRRPKADNFGSNRGKREKDFFSFFFVPLSCRWSNEGFDHSFSRPLSQLGRVSKRRASCHAPGVSQGTTVRCTVMEADHAKASAKISSPWLTDGQETQSFPSGERRRSRVRNERFSKKQWWEGTRVIVE